MPVSRLFRLISSLTPGRLGNLLLNEGSYLISRLTGKPRMAGLPWAISIEPTTSCNLRCPECPSGLRQFTRPTGSLDMDTFRSIIDPLSRHLIYLTLYFQGEPLLNRHFPEMVRYAKKQRLFVSTSTNANLLDDETARKIVDSGLDHLIVSMDGTDQETYALYRKGGELNKVLEGIRSVISWKKKLGKQYPVIELQFLVLGTNEHQIGEIRRIAKELKVDKLSLKSAQLYETRNNPFLTTLKRYARYKDSGTGFAEIQSRLPDRCHRMWHAPVVTWDGKVLPCCFDKDASRLLGSLSNSGLADIWYQEPAADFRKAIFKNRKAFDICRNCTEGLKHP